MNAFSLACYIFAGVIFASSLVAGVRGIIEIRKRRQFELDERGIIKWQEREKDEKEPNRSFEQYLLSQILWQISQLPGRNEFYFTAGVLVALSVAIIATLTTTVGMIPGQG